jgi:hypothetical protein
MCPNSTNISYITTDIHTKPAMPNLTKAPSVADMRTRKASFSMRFLIISSAIETVDMTPIATPRSPAMSPMSGFLKTLSVRNHDT